jgi:hypothetical protein
VIRFTTLPPTVQHDPIPENYPQYRRDRVQSDPTDMPKTAAQLNAEIKAVLSEGPQLSRTPRLRLPEFQPVEGLRIPAASRTELIRFWSAHPALRRGCLRKYGFDPIDDEEAYWRFGLAEPDHRAVLRAVRRNNNRFSLALVQRWEIEERRDAIPEGGLRSGGGRR